MRFLPVVLLLCFSFPHLAQAHGLRIGLGMQSKTQLADGNLQRGGLPAFNESLAREICRRIQVHCVITHMMFSEILPAIAAQKIDLGFGNFLRTSERDQRFAFSDSIWRSSSRLIATPATVLRFAAEQGPDVTIDNLRNARIVAVADTRQFLYLQSVAQTNDLTVVPAETIADAFDLLRQGKVDFHFLPMLSAYSFIGFEPGNRFEFFGVPEVGHGLGGTVHIALPKDDEALRLKVNEAIAGLRADGSYHRIVRRYFPFSLE